MAFTFDDLNYLKSVLSQIHKQFQYKPDHELWKKSEHWESDTTLFDKVDKKIPIKGDCEEFARCCLYMVDKAGYKARLIVGYLQGEGHCWCEVTDSAMEEAVYMDNNYKKLLKKSEMIHRPIVASPWNPVKNDTRMWVGVKK